MASLGTVGIDTGGTFTDLVAQGPKGLRTVKVASTPNDPATAVLTALARAGGLGERDRVHHGTTVATNTVLTRTGARVGIVATEGFSDALLVGRGHRTRLFALAPSRTAPLFSPRDVVSVPARRDERGRALRPLRASDVAAAVAALARRGVEAAAVVLLHATVCGDDEAEVARALASLGVPVSASHRVSSDAREVERGETTLLDAYVAPRLAAYLSRLARALPAGVLSVARCDGTRTSAKAAALAPVRTLLSGPAAGVAAVAALARRLRLPRALGFDVGGTSTDVAWVERGALAVTTDRTFEGFALGVPSLDVHAVGAGGGSVVDLDAGGALRVGPKSAGADPGPACYGRGGPFTLTDALLLLGRLPHALLRGEVPLSIDAPRREAARLARRAHLSVRALCEGVVAVAETATARAVRLASAAAGHDPRGAALVAFGGAGGLLAAAVADRLGLGHVVVPWSPGTFAAQGARIAPRGADASADVRGMEDARLRREARRLLSEAKAALRAQGEAAATGPGQAGVEVDARYAGQGGTVTLPWGPAWRAAFHAAHRARRGWADPAREVEAVTLRARALSAAGDLDLGEDARPARAAGPRVVGRTVPGLSGAVRHVERGDLSVGARVAGPACVVEPTGTTWVPPGFVTKPLPDGTLVVARGAS